MTTIIAYTDGACSGNPGPGGWGALLQARDGDTVLKEGDWISIDGFSGEVFAGQINTSPSEVMEVLTGNKSADDSETFQRYAQLMAWADEHRTLNVRANTESHDA